MLNSSHGMLRGAAADAGILRSQGYGAPVAKKRDLAEYEAKRDFAATPEPKGARPRAHAKQGPRFVVQEHHARALHWDLRLERDGVLASWAVPKGIPSDPKRNHLAVQTEDHPLEYLTFDGEIPAGEYGGGNMLVWDRGTYETEKWSEREVMVTFYGERVRGKYVLFQTRGNQWMIHKADDPFDRRIVLIDRICDGHPELGGRIGIDDGLQDCVLTGLGLGCRGPFGKKG